MTVQKSFEFGDPITPGTAPPPPSSGSARRRNLVIEAGAGTGKTTAIVAEVLKLVLSGEDVSPERIVLMTFTEKAAGEIADRIHAALAELEALFDEPRVAWPVDSSEPLFEVAPGQREVAREACAAQLARIHLLRSQTIHSFCQSLLRQFPIEAGLDPQFRIVEGFERSRLYGELYDAWVDEETRVLASPEVLREWEVLLVHAGYLFLVRQMIFSLVNRRDLLAEQGCDLGDVGLVDAMLREALAKIPPPGLGVAAKWTDGGAGKGVNPAQLQRYVHSTPLPPDGAEVDDWIVYFSPIANLIRTLHLTDVRGDFKDALSALRTGKTGDSIYDRLVSHRAALALHRLATRFIAFLDREKRKLGVVDFDDLLLRTLALLDDAQVLARVRRQYDTIFVDEFQDTDRTQAKIIERLAWDATGAFVPGKLVVVGDPKQSIYGFRRADPETYHRMTASLTAGGAELRPLIAQYRSDALLLEAINAMSARIFPDGREHDVNVFRTRYTPLLARKSANGRDLDARITLLHAGHEDKADQQLCEAESIAAWIAAHRDFKDGDLKRFALLFRRLTVIDDYLEVFERHGIDYVLPPSRQFLDRRAPVDLVAVLRAIAWPFDRGAQISAARTPYFALTDEEITAGILFDDAGEPAPGNGAGNEREHGPDGGGITADAAKPWRDVGRAIARHREASSQLTVAGLIDRVVDEGMNQGTATGSIEALYDMTADGVRARRHLDHLRAIAFEYDRKIGGSVRQFVAEIDRRRTDPDEMEPLLIDETRNAIRILTVHAAKGLEFETVILPDLGFGGGGSGESSAIFTVEDPRSLVFCQPDSLSAHFRHANGVELKKIAGAREEAESRRLFYVAVTRAKSEVVFVCNNARRETRTSFLACMNEALAIDVGSETWGDGREVRDSVIGPVAFERCRIAAAEGHRRPRLLDEALESTVASGPLATVQIAEPAVAAPLSTADVAARRAASRNRAAGTLLHRFLEVWDGHAPAEALLVSLAAEAGAGTETVARVRERVASIRRSPVMARIASAETIARELPIQLIGPDGGLIVRRIDRLIRENGREVVVDYKSGAPMDHDREQVAEYCAAIRAMTGRECRGMVWYVESDDVVEVDATARRG